MSFLLILITVVLVVAEYFISAVILVVISQIGLIIVFVVGRYSFSRAVAKSGAAQDDDVKDALELVDASAIIHTILFSVLVFFSILYYVLFNTSVGINEIGKFNFVLFFRDLILVIAIALICFELKYVNETLLKMRKSSVDDDLNLKSSVDTSQRYEA